MPAITSAVEKAGRDLQATVAEVRGDFDSSVYNDDFVQNWLDTRARGDLGLQRIWLNRENDPQAFRGAVAGLQRQFYKTFRAAPDHDLTEDRHAVVAAMRGASGRVPAADPPPSYGRMGTDEYPGRRFARNSASIRAYDIAQRFPLAAARAPHGDAAIRPVLPTRLLIGHNKVFPAFLPVGTNVQITE